MIGRVSLSFRRFRFRPCPVSMSVNCGTWRRRRRASRPSPSLLYFGSPLCSHFKLTRWPRRAAPEAQHGLACCCLSRKVLVHLDGLSTQTATLFCHKDTWLPRLFHLLYHYQSSCSIWSLSDRALSIWRHWSTHWSGVFSNVLSNPRWLLNGQ